MPPKTIKDFLPDAEAVLNLEPEELAGHLLEFLIIQARNDAVNYRSSRLSRRRFTDPSIFRKYAPNDPKKIAEAVTEMWVWLEREGLIAPEPGQSDDSVFITRRGLKLENRTGVEAYRKANLLPKGLLHPTIVTKVYAAFLRGEYATAVSQAFLEVEVAVRTAGKFDLNDFGKDLMRKAFDPNKSGPLTDTNAPTSEQEALGHLFAGAFGYFRNPTVHRNVVFTAEEAVEVIMLASHLLRIVDARSSSP